MPAKSAKIYPVKTCVGQVIPAKDGACNECEKDCGDDGCCPECGCCPDCCACEKEDEK